MAAWLVLACAFGLAAEPAPAPPSGERRRDDPAIIVTGERSEQTLLDLPSSVEVFTADSLDRIARVDQLDDLLAYIPNVQTGSGGEGPTIRGQDSTGVLRDLPAFLGGTRPRTSLQIDGRSVGFNEFVFGAAPLWDVERVELFRSPQSTTQGRNSIGGAIFIETRDPTYDWQGAARLIGDDAENGLGSAMVSGPILADRLAFRVAAERREGRTASWLGKVIPGVDPNRDDHLLVRAKLLAEPQFLPGARLELTYSHVETQAPQVEGVQPPFRRRRDPSVNYGVIRTNVESVSAVLRLRPAADLQTTSTLTFGDAFIRRFSRPGVGRTRTWADDMSAETVARWTPSARLGVTAGFHLIAAGLRQEIDLAFRYGTGMFDDDQHSLGLFGEVEYRPLPALRLTAGLRHQRDRQRRVGAVGDERQRFPIDYDGRFDALLPKFTLTYALSEHMRVGAQVQRAYNAGGATLNPDNGDRDTFEAERLWAYELFWRVALLDDRLTARANLFYNDIRNAQRPQTRFILFPDGTTIALTNIDNAPAAETYGAELDVGWRLTPRLDVDVALGLLGTRTLRTVDPQDPILGKRFQRSPTMSLSASIAWRPVDALLLSVQARHRSGYFSDDANARDRRIGAATVLDVKLNWSRGTFSLFGYVRNLGDAFYLTYRFNPVLATAGDPREIGIGVSARF